MKGVIFILIIALTGCVLGERRAPETSFQDSAIDSKIHYDLIHSDQFGAETHVNVTVYNRKVLLTGQVPNETLKQTLTDMTKNTENVQSVYNELTIGPATGLVQRTTDAWVTTHIKGLLLAQNSYGLNQTKVITERNAVYLMGIVTEQEARVATEKAKSVKGVTEVTTFFEYIATEESL